MSKQLIRLTGAVLALGGIIIIGYALFSYFSQRELEAELTAQIPGQNSNSGATTTPIALAPVSNGGAGTLF